MKLILDRNDEGTGFWLQNEVGGACSERTAKAFMTAVCAMASHIDWQELARQVNANEINDGDYFQ